MSDIKKLLSELEEAGKMTDCERGALMESLSLISERFDPCSCDSIFINLAIQELKDLQAENAELRKQGEWIDKKVSPVNFHSDWKDGEKALAINFNSEKPYAFEIEREDDLWCSIGGEEFTHWMPLPEVIKGWCNERTYKK